MRTSERLKGLQTWLDAKLCEGREMKAPAPDFDITKIRTQRPRVYMGWQPQNPQDMSNGLSETRLNVCPGILVMPSRGYGKYVEEKRFDRYNNVRRPQAMGQTLNVDILFSVYEPGVRLPGFIESGSRPQGFDMSLLKDGTEEGLYTLFNWMDDCVMALLAEKVVPETDLVISESDITYSLYTDQNYIVDKRPIFYGFVRVLFNGYADDGQNSSIEKYLE